MRLGFCPVLGLLSAGILSTGFLSADFLSNGILLTGFFVMNSIRRPLLYSIQYWSIFFASQTKISVDFSCFLFSWCSPKTHLVDSTYSACNITSSNCGFRGAKEWKQLNTTPYLQWANIEKNGWFLSFSLTLFIFFFSLYMFCRILTLKLL